MQVVTMPVSCLCKEERCRRCFRALQGGQEHLSSPVPKPGEIPEDKLAALGSSTIPKALGCYPGTAVPCPAPAPRPPPAAKRGLEPAGAEVKVQGQSQQEPGESTCLNTSLVGSVSPQPLGTDEPKWELFSPELNEIAWLPAKQSLQFSLLMLIQSRLKHCSKSAS